MAAAVVLSLLCFSFVAAAPAPHQQEETAPEEISVIAFTLCDKIVLLVGQRGEDVRFTSYEFMQNDTETFLWFKALTQRLETDELGRPMILHIVLEAEDMYCVGGSYHDSWIIERRAVESIMHNPVFVF